MNKLKSIMACLLVSLAVPGFLATATAQDECQDENSGAGWESGSCTFSCNRGETVYVMASQSGNDYVEGSAECDTSSAECAEDDGACSKRAEVPAAAGSHSGDCSGQAYDSWAWTSFDIECGSGDNTGLAALIAALVKDDPSDCDTADAIFEAANAVGHVTSFVRASANGDTVEVLAVNANGCTTYEKPLQRDNGWLTISL